MKAREAVQRQVGSSPAATRSPARSQTTRSAADSPRQLKQQRRIDQLTAPVQRVPVNDDVALEREADRMGAQAMRHPGDDMPGRARESRPGQSSGGGLPPPLRHGMESLSGIDLSAVTVHRNSDQPAQLNALAYAQGNDIHLAPGQEKQLPHEAWHVVQQKQGRVRPTLQMRRDVEASPASAFTQPGATVQRVLKVKDEVIIKTNNTVFGPVGKRHARDGIDLLNDMIDDDETYEFRNLTELQEALGAQIYLNERADSESPQTTTAGLIHGGKTAKVSGLTLPEKDTQKEQAMAAAFMIAEKYGVPFFGRVSDVRAWGGPNLVIQTAQQRGDKAHVLPALAIDKTMRLVLCFESNFQMVSEGDLILEAYTPVRDQVCVYYGSPNAVAGAGGTKSLTHSTLTLQDRALKDPLSTREKIKTATTGEMTELDMQLYEQWAQDIGFVRSHRNKYVIISHRDSGHKVPEGRIASHPEMDTGEAGFAQMIHIVGSAGFIPVPMGEPAGDWGGINMVKWWLKTPKGFKGKTKGQIEYGMIRFLAEQYGVRLLAMRSGNTDAMAFAGMETIFIDMATEGAPAEEIVGASLSGEAHKPHNRSWRRAAMLETILPGVFHQVFIQRPRKDKAFPHQDQPWDGSFEKEDVTNLEIALRTFFGEAGRERYNVVERSETSPLHSKNKKSFTKTVDQDRTTAKERLNPRHETFEAFSDELVCHGEQQQSTFHFRLNRIDLILQNVETRLHALSADLDRLEAQLIALEKDYLELTQ